MKLRARAVAGVIGAVALLLGLALLSWLAAQRHRDAGDTARRPPTAPLAAPALRQPPHIDSAAAGPRAAAAPAAAAPTPPGEAPRVFGPDEVELCGFGAVKLDSAAADELARAANNGLEHALQTHLQRMRRSADANTRAAALMALGDYAALAEQAQRSDDPTVYAFAQQACERQAAAPQASQACQMLSAEQAARLDPDNAVVWLQLAAEADRRKDSDTVAAALHRATTATTVNARTSEFAALAVAALPAQLPQGERMSAFVGLVGIQAGLSLPPLGVVVRHCGEALMADANRRQTCDALATLLVDKGRSILEMAIGRRIGERVGWPRERTLLLAAHQHAYQSAYFEELATAPGSLLGCEALRRGERWWQAVAIQGERAAAQALLARTDPSPDELIERYQRHLSQRAEAAAQAASAASAASATSAPK